MIEKLDPNDLESFRVSVQLIKLNELIDAYNKHMHYVSKKEFYTSIPDDPILVKEEDSKNRGGGGSKF